MRIMNRIIVILIIIIRIFRAIHSVPSSSIDINNLPQNKFHKRQKDDDDVEGDGQGNGQLHFPLHYIQIIQLFALRRRA